MRRWALLGLGYAHDSALSALRIFETGGAMKEPKTYGDLKHLLAKSPEGDWPSRVNPGMTHSQVLQVLRNGLVTHPDDQPLDSSPRGFLYARNVLRECRTRMPTRSCAAGIADGRNGRS